MEPIFSAPGSESIIFRKPTSQREMYSRSNVCTVCCLFFGICEIVCGFCGALCLLESAANGTQPAKCKSQAHTCTGNGHISCVKLATASPSINFECDVWLWNGIVRSVESHWFHYSFHFVWVFLYLFIYLHFFSVRFLLCVAVAKANAMQSTVTLIDICINCLSSIFYGLLACVQ